MDETWMADAQPEADAFESLSADSLDAQTGTTYPSEGTGAGDLSFGDKQENQDLQGPEPEKSEALDSPPENLFDEAEENPQKEGEQAFTLAVKYNKQYRELNPEQARMYAQKGMKYESLEPSLNKLKYLAASTGASLTDVVDKLYAASDQLLMQKLLKRTGGDQVLADTLFQAEKEKQGKAYAAVVLSEKRAAATERYDTTQRLAGEFLELQKECPELDSFSKVPEMVAKAAALKGTRLMDEYLLYRHRQERLANAEAGRQKRTGEAAMGSQAGGGDDGLSAQVSAMLKGVWQG